MAMSYVFRAVPELKTQTVSKLWKTFLGHARWLHEHEAHGYRAGNWQVTGCLALLLLGRFVPEFKEAPRWTGRAVGLLMERCDRDFYRDGCYSERCPGYNTIGLHFLPELYEVLADVGGHDAERRKLKSVMKRAYRWFMLEAAPLATSTATGDSGYVDLGSLLKNGARYTGDGEMLWPVRGELTRADRRWLPTPRKPRFTSVNLRPSGFAVMRTGWEPDDLYMMVNWGPYGGGHSHSHKLDFELFAFGEGLALDTSRFDSYDNPLDPYFRSARAHNQVVVNDADLNERETVVAGVLWRSDGKADFFAGSHNGYAASHGVTVTRKVVFVKPDWWLVSDLLEETAGRRVYTWYLHSHLPFRAGRDKSFVTGKGPGLQVVPARPDEIRHVQQGVGYTQADWRYAGKWPERRWIGYRKFDHVRDYATYAVLLCPFRSKPRRASIAPVPVTDAGGEVDRRTAEAFQVTVDGRTHLVALSHARAARRSYGPVASDRRIAVYERSGGRWRVVSAAP
jgi:hypothetical protein